VEAKRLVAMRQSALTAMRDANLLTRNISLHLLVHLGRDNSRSVGDLEVVLVCWTDWRRC
jgi:hypothetical protein